uniref:Uncharacterized protein n=1 Tax=Sphaerodactylus townsendi TaxID=933632 RepID=A0ACB8E7B3_9SAUR
MPETEFKSPFIMFKNPQALLSDLGQFLSLKVMVADALDVLLEFAKPLRDAAALTRSRQEVLGPRGGVVGSPPLPPKLAAGGSLRSTSPAAAGILLLQQPRSFPAKCGRLPSSCACNRGASRRREEAALSKMVSAAAARGCLRVLPTLSLQHQSANVTSTRESTWGPDSDCELQKQSASQATNMQGQKPRRTEARLAEIEHDSCGDSETV